MGGVAAWPAARQPGAFAPTAAAPREHAEHIAQRHQGVLLCARDALSVAALREVIGERLGAIEQQAALTPQAQDELAG